MAIKYISYFPDSLQGQALLDNFTRTKRVLKYRDNDKTEERILRGMPLYEAEEQEQVGDDVSTDNLLIRGECLSACAYLKDKGIKVDLVYIDPPFASGADYAKKIYIRRNPKVAQAIEKAEQELSNEDLKNFEEKMYGDIWDKERYLNWMYENLMAIKSVMSDTASVYVHLDWHIGHYVKILMDEIFGEDNFLNEIIWQYTGGMQPVSNFARKHDTIYRYSKSDEWIFNTIYVPYSQGSIDRFDNEDENGRFKITYRNGESYKTYMKEGKPVEDVWNIPIVMKNAEEFSDYATQKPEALLERIIKASSNEGMVVADFFGGSGVTASVCQKLQRKFIHCDVNINSIQTTRDRLRELDSSFRILEIKDGVSLYRNPVQTMDKLKSLIPGLKNEDALDKFWEGSINDTKEGMIPVYLPNLMDSSTRVLDKALMNRILHEAMPDLPEDTKKVVVYYIDIDNKEEIESFIKDGNHNLINVELRDLKTVLDEVVAEDKVLFSLKEERTDIFKGWKTEINSFHSDRVHRKIQEYNLKGQEQVLKAQNQGKEKKFIPIIISNEGLETIEMIALDCTEKTENAVWHSDEEIKIDTKGYVILNGRKTKTYWDGCIRSEKRPLRMKIRNICGDETVFLCK